MSGKKDKATSVQQQQQQQSNIPREQLTHMYTNMSSMCKHTSDAIAEQKTILSAYNSNSSNSSNNNNIGNHGGGGDDVTAFQPKTGTPLEILREISKSPSFRRYLVVILIMLNVRQIFRHLDSTWPKYMIRGTYLYHTRTGTTVFVATRKRRREENKLWYISDVHLVIDVDRRTVLVVIDCFDIYRF